MFASFSEFKYLKTDRPFPSHIIDLIEDLAVSYSVCTVADILKSKKSIEMVKKLISISNWFTISRIKNIKVDLADSFLLQAFIMVVDEISKISEAKLSPYKIMKKFLVNQT